MIAFKFPEVSKLSVANYSPNEIKIYRKAQTIRPNSSQPAQIKPFLNSDITSTIQTNVNDHSYRYVKKDDLIEHRKVYTHLQKYRDNISYSKLCDHFKNVILTENHNSEILSDKTFVKEFIKFIILYDFYINQPKKKSRGASKSPELSSAEVINLLSQIDTDPDCNNITQTTSTQKEQRNQGSPKKMTCGKVAWNSTQKTDGKLFLSGKEFPWERSQGSKTGRSRPTTAQDTPAAGRPTPRGMGGGKKTKRLHKKKRGKRTRHFKKNQTRPLRKNKVKPTKKK